jgi:NAD-dependent SIR2 family protein deacetylase
VSKDFDERVESLAKLMFRARHMVLFTGAGISTESGLPDFRGPDGLWTRRDKGLPPPPMGLQWHLVPPNNGHLAIVELQNIGKLKFLISQNVDNLHLKSGIRPELLAELHGNITKLRCPNCGSVYDRSSGLRSCRCGGMLAPSTVGFGQPLPERDLMLSFEHSRKSDLFIVAGSSLVVTPAADMPKEALRAGAKLVIINQGPTPFDRLANLRFHEKTGETLPKAAARLKILMNLS